jgi:3-deoxy-D-manno-octulosonic acid kinase
VVKVGGSVIVYDDARVSHITPELFDPEYWGDVDSAPGYSGGRGATLYVNHAGNDWVVRHYHRGGVVGRFLHDQFLWLGEANSRPFAEWDLLAAIQRDDLPAPAPVAARYVRRGRWYTADLITVRLPDVMPFSNRITSAPVDEKVWADVGRCIGRFHAAGYFHADLSTHNLQIGADDTIYLLDFDRGDQRSAGNWKQQNLERLHRSCLKISRDGAVNFRAEFWQALLAGYREVCP